MNCCRKGKNWCLKKKCLALKLSFGGTPDPQFYMYPPNSFKVHTLTYTSTLVLHSLSAFHALSSSVCVYVCVGGMRVCVVSLICVCLCFVRDWWWLQLFLFCVFLAMFCLYLFALWDIWYDDVVYACIHFIDCFQFSSHKRCFSVLVHLDLISLSCLIVSFPLQSSSSLCWF